MVRRVRSPLREMADALRRFLRYDARAGSTETLIVEPTFITPSADARAKELLVRVLSPSQREQYQRYGYFTVRLEFGSYCILPRTRFNVVNMQTGTAYCAGPEVAVPLADLMLAQKLCLEHDPDRFFRMANFRREERSILDGIT